MKELLYNRQEAVLYAKEWAFARNSKYYNFDAIGGDCTNFVSQCIYAGSGIMNYTKDVGWYYIDGNHKSPSWTGVQFLYDFLVKNKGIGPYGREVTQEDLEIGDVVQLSFDGQTFTHSTIIVDIIQEKGLEGIKIASHTFDSFGKKIVDYFFKKMRVIHINGVRK